MQNSTTPNTTGNFVQPQVDQISASDIINKYRNSTIEDISTETPEVIAAEIMILAAKLWEAGTFAIKAEQKFSEQWVNIRTEVDTDGQADKRAKRTQEYADLKMAQLQEKTVTEVLRGLKKLLGYKSEEAKNSYGL